MSERVDEIIATEQTCRHKVNESYMRRRRREHRGSKCESPKTTLAKARSFLSVTVPQTDTSLNNLMDTFLGPDTPHRSGPIATQGPEIARDWQALYPPYGQNPLWMSNLPADIKFCCRAHAPRLPFFG